MLLQPTVIKVLTTYLGRQCKIMLCLYMNSTLLLFTIELSPKPKRQGINANRFSISLGKQKMERRYQTYKLLKKISLIVSREENVSLSYNDTRPTYFIYSVWNPFFRIQKSYWGKFTNWKKCNSYNGFLIDHQKEYFLIFYSQIFLTDHPLYFMMQFVQHFYLSILSVMFNFRFLVFISKQ